MSRGVYTPSMEASWLLRLTSLIIQPKGRGSSRPADFWPDWVHCSLTALNVFRRWSYSMSLRAKWFWYSIACVLFWGAWTILEKMASTEIPQETVQFLFTFGALPVAVVLLVGRKFKLEKSPKGILYGLGNGVLAGVGNAALAAAYRAGGNTSVITAATAMYPMITVLLAVTILRERLTRLHKIGLVFAAIAFIIFSL